MVVKQVAAMVSSVILIAVCSAPVALAQSVVTPPANGKFDYQIGGSYQPAPGVAIVDRDRTDSPAPGVYNICYVNAFQTQSGETAWWKRKHPSLLLHRSGRPVMDQEWGEALLDTSTARKRRALTKIVGRWTDDCARRGFAGVEFDNLDSYSRSRGQLSESNNLAFARKLVARAHTAGLAAGQKNSTELGASGKAVAGFDFAIAEECQRYQECSDYTNVYSANVIEIEYTDYERSVYDAACAQRGNQISIILRDRDVVAAGQPGYVYEAC